MHFQMHYLLLEIINLNAKYARQRNQRKFHQQKTILNNNSKKTVLCVFY